MKHRVTRTLVTLSIGIAGVAGAMILLNNIANGRTEIARAATIELKAGMVDPQNGKKIKYWVAPMDPTYIRNEPGKSPMGMDLVPKYEEEGASSEPTSIIRVDPTTMQNMGVRLAPVERKSLSKTIRAFGNITYDEGRLHTVNTKFDGWIEKLNINYIGQRVVKGQALFSIYSPDLVIAQQEYLMALRQYRKISGGGHAQIEDNARRLLDAARTRLKYWDISDAQISSLEANGKPHKTITVHSPATGVVLKKDAYEGHFVKAGQHQFEVADLSRVWVDVEVYEYELPWVHQGMPAVMDLPYIPGKQFKGRVLYVYPYLTQKTRTARLRLEFPNETLELKPDMYANVYLESVMDRKSLVIPQEAVIDSGVRKLAFVSRGEGRFEPREIQLGLEVNGSDFQVLAGLSEGEQVVTSAQFMLDSESRLREAVQKMLEVRSASLESANTGDLDMSQLKMEGGGGDDLDMSRLTMEPDKKAEPNGESDL